MAPHRHAASLAETIRLLLTRKGAPVTATDERDAARLARAVEAAAAERAPKVSPLGQAFDAAR